MQDTRCGDEENTQVPHGLHEVRRKYRILFFVKCGLGSLLLVLGWQAVENTKVERNTIGPLAVGPPYYEGAFIVGCAMTLAGLMDIFMYLNLDSDDLATLQSISQCTCVEVFLSAFSIVGGIIGIYFASSYGVPECDPSDYFEFSSCNYVVNMTTNRNLAIVILVFLLVSEVITVGSVVVQYRTCRDFRLFSMLKTRETDVSDQNVDVPNVLPSPEGQCNYVDVPTAPSSPEGQCNYVDVPTAPSSPEGQVNISDEPSNNLQEQIRLLTEQMALQQQQLQLLQQQQQHEQHEQQQGACLSTLLSPPPSYESCLQNPVQIEFLQQENEEVQNRYQSQQEGIKMPSSDDKQTTPSAPPM